jgi:MoaA/NifB/PqqE/SkfB family radical SAM enzyme
MKLRSTRDNNYLYIDWWLMNHCNYNCSYCPDILKNGSIDLPNIVDCKAAVDQINSFANTQGKKCHYYLTGGEVTQWPWLIDLVEHIKQKNNYVRMRTNVSMPITEWQRLISSVDSINIEVHSEHTPISHFMLCLHAAKKKNVNVSITVNMLPDRWQELEGVISKIQQIWPDQHVHRKMLFEDPAINKQPMQYQPEQKVKLKRQHGDLISVDEQGEEEFTDFQTLLFEGKNKFQNQTCQAGIEQLIIDAWGRIKRGHCGQGGLVGKLGIEFAGVQNPVICKADACRNGFDITATKQ